MNIEKNKNSATAALIDPYRSLRWAGLVFAIAFPTIVTWGYFVLADRYAQGTQQSVYLILKVIQFAFPALWTWIALRERLRTSRPTASGVLMGLLFGVIIAGLATAIFSFFLRDLPIFTSAAELIQQKVKAFGIDSAGKYIVLASFYSLVHSGLEEYYWRWFVFRQLQRVVSLWPAIILSGLAF